MRNERGMTLIEIMIVLAIVGGLMAVLGTRLIDNFEKGKVKTTKIQINEIGKQLETYNMDCNSYPSTEQGLEALVKAPQGEPGCESWGPNPYTPKLPKDAWGNNFIYESDGMQYTLTSLGKDKREGGEGFAKDLSNADQ